MIVPVDASIKSALGAEIESDTEVLFIADVFVSSGGNSEARMRLVGMVSINCRHKKIQNNRFKEILRSIRFVYFSNSACTICALLCAYNIDDIDVIYIKILIIVGKWKRNTKYGNFLLNFIEKQCKIIYVKRSMCHAID